MAVESAEGSLFDLANALACETDFFADFLQSPRPAIFQAKVKAENLGFTLVDFVE